MAKHLTEQDFDNILSHLDGWQGKLTWDNLCESVVDLVGKRPTRQSLNSHLRIKIAFNNKKERLKRNINEIKTPPSLAIAGQRIKRLEEQNARLKAENSRFLELFVIWQYNAYRHGLKESQLNASLPVVDRDSSEHK